MEVAPLLVEVEVGRIAQLARVNKVSSEENLQHDMVGTVRGEPPGAARRLQKSKCI